MWCEHCRDEVLPVGINEQTGTSQCPLCKNELSLVNELGTASIAQTAHALLKRWEETRPVAESEEGLGLVEQEPTPKSKQPQPRTSVAKSSLSHDDLLSQIPTVPQITSPPKTSPVGKSISAETNAGQTSRNKEAEEFVRQEERKVPLQVQAARKTFEPPVSTPIPAKPAVVQEPVVQSEVKSPSQQVKQTKQTRTATPISRPSPAAQNDAGSLLNRNPLTASKQPQKKSSSQTQKKTEPQSFALPKKSEKPMKTTRTEPAPQPAAAKQGRVQFASTENQEEKLDDLGIQQAIETHHRKRRNWSVIFGQFIVYCGAIAMTCGGAVVIANRFGSLEEIAETTGWLTLAGGHLLFILGIYMNLSSRMEQLLSDVHQRNDDIARLLIQQQSQPASPTFSSRSSAGVPNFDADNVSFQRSSLQKSA